jgi:tetrahydromethanopterin S-methyltransferase subunit F
MGLRGVLLTESDQVGSPLVIGRCEICIPSAPLANLSNAELDSVLAHELAHIERADGVWFPIVGAVQAVLWLNPLNHFLASRFRDSAELACDDRALELTRDPLCLARALVQVATSASFARRSAMVPTMIRSKSALLPRVRRLTSGAAATGLRARESGRMRAIASLALLACLLGALSVQVAQARPMQATAVPKAQSPSVASAPAPLAPDASEASLGMAQLAAREQSLLAQLEASPERPGLASTGSADSVRVLELQQELRHVRATRLWVEARFVSESAAFAKSSASRSASR